MKRLVGIFLCAYIICFQGFSQTPIFVTVSGGDLYSLDITNCTSNFIGSTGKGFGDIAFTPDGRLWGILGGNLYLINIINASTKLIGSTGLHGISLVGLNDFTLLIEDNMKLYGINTVNASTYYIGDIGYQASGDLTWYDHDLYMTTSSLLIKIVLNDANTSILSSTPVNNIINPIPTCEGLVTAPIVCSNNALIGFSGSNVYKICQIDGTYEMLCPSILPNSIPGGASYRLPVQLIKPTSCEVQDCSLIIPNLITPNNDHINDFFQIKIRTKEPLITFQIKIYNRWGELVYFSKDPNFKWGADNVNDGIFYYCIEYNFSELIKGWLEVIR